MPESIFWTLWVLRRGQFLAGTKKYYFDTFLQRNFDRARGKGTGIHLLGFPVYTGAYTQSSRLTELSRNLPGALGAFPEPSRRLPEPSRAFRSSPGAFPEPFWSIPGTFLEPSEPSRNLPGALGTFPEPSRSIPRPSWNLPEPSWSLRSFPGAFREPPGAFAEPSRRLRGAFPEHPGTFLEPPGASQGQDLGRQAHS